MGVITLPTRIQQGLRALTPSPQAPVGREALRSLTSPQRRVFERLSRFDQEHLLSVHDRLMIAGPASDDLQVAALLHDVAKGGTAAQPGRVCLIHRVAIVLLGPVPGSLLAHLCCLPAPAWRVGFALALHHATLGADEASRLGCSPRTCWLIRHHHDPAPQADMELQRLICADHVASKARVD